MSMNNVASMNPSLPAENAQCAAPASRWNQLAHLVGAHLAKLGTGRAIRHTKPGELLGVLDDLVRRGMVARSRGGWYRITDAGVLAFPSEACDAFKLAPEGLPVFWLNVNAQPRRRCAAPRVALAGVCDIRPESWAELFSHTEPCTPHRTPAELFQTARRARRTPVQIVHGTPHNIAPDLGLSGHDLGNVPSLEETIDRAPAREHSDWQRFMSGYWPGVGATDTFPAARIGYPGLTVERRYA